MVFQFKIYEADATGVSGAGGSPTSRVTTNIVPPGLTTPYRGQGPRYVHKKYFLSVTQFTEETGVPTISNVRVQSITNTGAQIVYTTDEPTDTRVSWGVIDSSENMIYDATLRTGHTGQLTNLLEYTTYNYNVSSTDVDDNNTFYDGTFTTLDLTAPTFSNIMVDTVTPSGARVVWSTNENSTSQVFYGVAGLTGSTLVNPTLVKIHRVTLSNLAPSTTYTFRPVSIDGFGNSGQGSIRNFVTSANSGVIPLTITGVTSGTFTASGATINWTTNLPSDSLVLYSSSILDLTGAPGDLTSTQITGETGAVSTTVIGNLASVYNSAQTLLHTGVITNAIPNTRYYYKVRSADGFGQTVDSPSGQTGYFFNTTGNVAPFVTWSGINITTGSAAVGFWTNTSTTGSVAYNTSASYLFGGGLPNIITQAGLSTGHYITMTGLVPLTNYTYQVRAVDTTLLTGLDVIRTFKTVDTQAPIISVLVSGVSASGAIFNWHTDELATSVGRLYLSGNQISNLTGNNGSLVLNHTVRFLNLTPSTSYVYNIESVDASNNVSGVSGNFMTSGQPIGPDITPPLIYNINSAVNFTFASISWETDELSSTVVNYGLVTPTTGVTGQSGSNGANMHSVIINPLPEGQTIVYTVTSTDAAGNSATSAQQSLITTTQGTSNFAEGDRVATIEFEVPQGALAGGLPIPIPIRVSIPVRDSNDLVFNWKVGTYIVDRQVIKRTDDDQPKIVSIEFPYTVAQGVPVGGIVQIPLIATQASQSITWNAYTVPELTLKMQMSGTGGNSVASMLIPTNGSTKQVIGDGGSKYSRTYKIYNRCQVGATSVYHPTTKGAGVHTYITVYNKDIFPGFFPRFDIRVNNCWVDESNYANRGCIYYKSMSIDFPSVTDGFTYKLTADVIENSTSETATSLVIVKPQSQIVINPHPNGDPNVWVGGSQAGYNALYTNDLSDHALLQGTVLEWRLALWNSNEFQSKQRMQQAAGLEFCGYAIHDGIAKRSWSNTASYGPMNTYCPTVNINWTFGGFVGRNAIDQKHKNTWLTVRNNLINGTYFSDPIAGADIGTVDGQPLSHTPVQYGPYRPASPPDNGGAPGGFQITPFFGFNHSKYSTLWCLYDHKMKLARHYQFMYSASPAVTSGPQAHVADDGEPCYVGRWANNNNANSTTHPPSIPGAGYPGTANVGTIAIAPLLDQYLPMFQRFYSNANTWLVPWNAPTVPITNNHVFANGEGCSYHEDRTSYTFTNNNPSSAPSAPPRYALLAKFPTIDHQHQIRFAQNLWCVAEYTNDQMIRDDLLNQAVTDMCSFAHKPTNNIDFGSGYNLWESYYGWTRSNSGGGVFPNPNRGTSVGRTRGWPLYTIAGAYQLGDDIFRADALQNLLFWALFFKTAYNTGLGFVSRQYNTVTLTQHIGLSHNGILMYLRGDTTLSSLGGAFTGFDLLAQSFNSPTNANYTTTLNNTDGFKLVAQFAGINNPSDGHLGNGSPGILSPYYNSVSLAALTSSPIYEPSNYQPTWSIGLWGSVTGNTAGSIIRYKVEVYLKNSSTGAETLISDPISSTSPTTFGTSTPTNVAWTFHQRNGATIDGNVVVPFHNSWDYTVVKLYAQTDSVATATLSTYYGPTRPMTIRGTMKGLGTCVYDHEQVFEGHICNLAYFCVAANCIKTHDPETSTIILQALRKFYTDFYTLPAVDFPIGGTQNSSTWGKIGPSTSAEAWVIAVATNNNFQGLVGPFSSFAATEGKFSIQQSANFDFNQYAPFSSYIGMRAEMELGQGFSLGTNLAAGAALLPYTPGFLMDKWRRMGNWHDTPAQHRDYIYLNDAPLGNVVWLTNASACIGHINFALGI